MTAGEQVSRTVSVNAPTERVWELVSDLPGMGRFSRENTGGSWAEGADGPAVGARFRGSNRAGWRRWGTQVVVVRCVPNLEFAFTAAAVGMVTSEWAYVLQSTGSGCTVTETWTDRRGRAIQMIGRLVTGVSDRAAFTAISIEHTLAGIKALAELVAQPAAEGEAERETGPAA